MWPYRCQETAKMAVVMAVVERMDRTGFTSIDPDCDGEAKVFFFTAKLHPGQIRKLKEETEGVEDVVYDTTPEDNGFFGKRDKRKPRPVVATPGHVKRDDKVVIQENADLVLGFLSTSKDATESSNRYTYFAAAGV